MHHQIGLKAISSAGVPFVCSAWRSHGGVFSRTWHVRLSPFLGYPTAAGRSAGSLPSLWNVHNTNFKTRPCIFGSWGDVCSCLIRARVECPVNHPSITRQEFRISALTVPSPSCSFSVFLSGFGCLWHKGKENAKDLAISSPENLESKRRGGKICP